MPPPTEKKQRAPAPLGSLQRPWAVAQATLIVIGVLAIAFVVWQLSVVFLLLFAAVILALLLRSIAGPLERYLRLPSPWSVGVAALLLAVIIAGAVYLMGAQIASEIASVNAQLPKLFSAVGSELGIPDFGEQVFERLREYATSGGVVSRVAGYTTGLASILAYVVLVLVAAVFLASRPDVYRQGVVTLAPPHFREEVAETLDIAGRALQLWLLGMLAAMALVGTAIFAGLFAIGLSSALALGLLAGLAEFIPIVGPLLAAIPALMLAMPLGWTTVAWVIALYLLVQQIENNVILPLINRRTVDIPPVLTMFALVAFGILFGPLGLLLAAPLTVLVSVVIKKLYLRDTLGEPGRILGEK